MGWETKTAPWAVVFVYWKRPEYPVRLAAGMNGRIMNCAPGGARLANKVFPVPRLIPRRGNPREPLAAGIGRGKFYFIRALFLQRCADGNTLFACRRVGLFRLCVACLICIPWNIRVHENTRW